MDKKRTLKTIAMLVFFYGFAFFVGWVGQFGFLIGCGVALLPTLTWFAWHATASYTGEVDNG